MPDRNSLREIRPSITQIIEKESMTNMEIFQNKVLRPILKFQNDLLISIFKNYIKKRKGTFHKLPKEDQLEYIEKSIQKDFRFRSLLIGTIIGHFTAEEYFTYESMEKGISKRIGDLLVQRLQDQLLLLP